MSLNCSRDLLHRFVSKVTTDSFYLERNIFQDLCIYLFAIFIMRIFYGYILTFSGLEKFLDNDGESSGIRESSPIHIVGEIPLNISPIIEI